MQDFIVYLSLILIAIFLILGILRKHELPYLISAVFFIINGIGIFTSGWQSYGTPTYTATTLGTTVTYTPTPLTTLAHMPGTPEQMTVYGVATFFILLGFFCVVLAGQEQRMNRAARRLN